MKVLLVTKQILSVRDDKVYCQFALSSTLEIFQRFGSLYVCACSDDQEATQPVDALTSLDVEHVAFIDGERGLKRRFFDRSQNKETIRRFARVVDMVIGYVPASVCDLAFRVAREEHKPYMTFLVACVWDGMWHHRNWKARLMAPIEFRATRHTVLHSDYAWYVTEEFLQRRYPTRGRSLGCTDTNIPEDQSDILERRMRHIDDNDGTITLLTVGHLDVGFKGQQFIIRALPELQARGMKVKLQMIGAGKGDHLMRLAESLNVKDCVEALGTCSRPQVLDYMDRADIYLQVSLQEGLPRSVAEAMSRAMPVIGSRTGGIPEMIEPEFVTRRKNVEDIVKVVLAMDKETMRRQAKRNFDASRKYLPSQVNARVNEFFATIKRELKG